MAEIIVIHSLAYTVPDYLVDEDIRADFRKLTELCGVPPYSFGNARPTPGFELSPIDRNGIRAAINNSAILNKKINDSRNIGNWFFNHFYIPLGYTGPTLTALPNARKVYSDGAEYKKIFL